MPATTPEDELAHLNSRTQRYALGQFFTPPTLARFMADAVREVQPETVLDPGVGGGILLRALGDDAKLFGLDIDPRAVSLTAASLPADCEIAVGDFLDANAWPLSQTTFDAIVSNPPYVKHHNLSAKTKALAGNYSKAFDVRVSGLSSSYVYFFLEALRRLNDGGRLVFLTPTEFLDARYGQAVKEALLSQCNIDEILVLDMNELAFDGVLTTSAITVATKTKEPSRRFRLTEGKLNGVARRSRSLELVADGELPRGPWTPLLPSRAERVAPLLTGRTAKLGDYCRVRRGIATGDNSFFCLTRADVRRWGIEDRFLVPAVLGSKDLPDGGPLDEAFRGARVEAGARAFLFYCHAPLDELAGTRALKYIEHGLSLGVHGRANCRARKPWYGVERVPPADFFTTYMSRDNARIVRNGVGARCMTSLLNLWAKPGIDPDSLTPSLTDPVNATLLREFGRTYGGGLGKIEPGDLVNLPVRPPAGHSPLPDVGAPAAD